MHIINIHCYSPSFVIMAAQRARYLCWEEGGVVEALADHSGRAFQGMNSLRLLKYWGMGSNPT
jgi:hypothetical protein